MTCPAKSARTEYGLLDPDQMVSHRQKRVLLDVFCISEVVGPMQTAIGEAVWLQECNF